VSYGNPRKTNHSATAAGYHQCGSCGSWRSCDCDDSATKAKREGFDAGQRHRNKMDTAELDRQMRANLPKKRRG